MWSNSVLFEVLDHISKPQRLMVLICACVNLVI
jgi:hypothetical protein